MMCDRYVSAIGCWGIGCGDHGRDRASEDGGQHAAYLSLMGASVMIEAGAPGSAMYVLPHYLCLL